MNTTETTVVSVLETGGEFPGWSVWLIKLANSKVEPTRKNLTNAFSVKKFLNPTHSETVKLSRANHYARDLGKFLGLEVHEAQRKVDSE